MQNANGYIPTNKALLLSATKVVLTPLMEKVMSSSDRTQWHAVESSMCSEFVSQPFFCVSYSDKSIQPEYNQKVK